MESSESQKTGKTNASDEYYKGSMTDYYKLLEDWLNSVYWQRTCATSAYYTALSLLHPTQFETLLGRNGDNSAQPTRGPIFPNVNVNEPNGNINGNVRNNENNNNLGVGQLGPNFPFGIAGFRTQHMVMREFAIAPLWKRFLAEAIDFIILLVIKVVITFTLMDNFDFIDIDSIDIDALQESGSLYDAAFSLTSELLLVEVIHRILVCIFESYCLCKGGATPGKSFMNLRVLQCEVLLPATATGLGVVPGETRVLVSPGTYLTFPRAFLRSFVKNLSMTFFFPMCFTLFHFDFNRALYDIAAKSIVVEVQIQQDYYN